MGENGSFTGDAGRLAALIRGVIDQFTEEWPDTG